MYWEINKYIKKGKNVQVIIGIIANFLMIGDGMHYAWPSAVTPILQSSDGPVGNVTNGDVTLLEIIYLAGGLAALPYVMYFPDKIGRKYTILGAMVVNTISWVMIAAFPNVTVYTVSRFLAGMTADMGYVSIPMYIAEIAEKDIRGLLCGLIYVMVAIGTTIMYSVGPFLSVVLSGLVGVLVSVVALVTFIFVPESPYYFLKKNKINEAEQSLKFLRGDVNVDEELQNIKAAVERQEQEVGSFSDLVSNKGNRKAFVLVSIVMSWPSVAGVHILFMNVNTILEETSNSVSSSLGGILFSLTLLIVGCVSMFMVDHFGRKNLLLSSGIILSFTLTLLATFSLLQFNNPQFAEKYDWIPLFCVLMYGAGLRLGLGFVPMVLNGEIFPTSVKAKGMTIADGFYLISGILCIYTYRELAETVDMFVPFYLFAFGTATVTFIVYVYLPETKGKTLEEIQLMLLK